MIDADRSVLQRLYIAREAGRTFDLTSVLSHELMSVPLALAETNRSLRTGDKAYLLIWILKSAFVNIGISHIAKKNRYKQMLFKKRLSMIFSKKNMIIMYFLLKSL